MRENCEKNIDIKQRITVSIQIWRKINLGEKVGGGGVCPLPWPCHKQQHFNDAGF